MSRRRAARQARSRHASRPISSLTRARPQPYLCPERLPVQFIDEAIIEVKAGDGGNGSAAFRREDGVPRGGPSGGDGGNGGSVVVVADPRRSSLLDYKFRRHYTADRGEDGRNKDQYGASGEDLVLRVPVGTVISEDAGGPLADLAEPGA